MFGWAIFVNFESIGRLENKDQIVYSERLDKLKVLRDIISIYTFEKEVNKTNVKVEVDYKIETRLGKLLSPFLREILKKRTNETKKSK